MKIKEYFTNAWNKTKETTTKAAEWCKEHPQEAIAIATLTGACVYNLYEIGTKQYNLYQTQMLKERYIYDRSNGHYFKMSHVPTTSEWLEIESRKKSGESLGWILRDMGLL